MESYQNPHSFLSRHEWLGKLDFLAGLIFAGLALYGAYLFVDDSDWWLDQSQYQKLIKDYQRTGRPLSCAWRGKNHHEVFEYISTDIINRPYPTSTRTYLTLKLAYYADSAHRHPRLNALFQQAARARLSALKDDAPLAPNALFRANRIRYAEVTERVLPLSAQLGSLVSGPLSDAITRPTHRHQRQLEAALALCEQIVELGTGFPSVFYQLDNGNGDSVPLDDLESEVILQIIARERNPERANLLYQDLIAYQVDERESYGEQVFQTLRQYRDFLDRNKLPRTTNGNRLKARVAQDMPHDYAVASKRFRQRTSEEIQRLFSQ